MIPCLRSDLVNLSAYHLQPLADDLLKLDANESAQDLPAHLKQELAQLVSKDIQGNRYPDGIYAELKEAIALYVGCGADWVTIGNGSDELIRSLLLVACLGRGGILVAEPTFSMYGILAQTLGVDVVRVGRDHLWGIDLASARMALAQGTIAAVFVVSPNSPTGNLLNGAEIEWLESLPPSVLVVVDEAYFEYAQVSLVDRLPLHPNWVILRTFSKGMRLAAYRVGYGIGHPEVIACLDKVRLPYNLPIVSARAAHLALMHRQELLANIPELRHIRDDFFHFLKDLGFRVWQSEGNFIYCQSGRDQYLMERLRSSGIVIRQTGGGLRITIGTVEEMEHCQRVLQAC
jgi:histidinol-phosphate aminotransferase